MPPNDTPVTHLFRAWWACPETLLPLGKLQFRSAGSVPGPLRYLAGFTGRYSPKPVAASRSRREAEGIRHEAHNRQRPGLGEFPSCRRTRPPPIGVVGRCARPTRISTQVHALGNVSGHFGEDFHHPGDLFLTLDGKLRRARGNSTSRGEDEAVADDSSTSSRPARTERMAAPKRFRTGRPRVSSACERQLRRPWPRAGTLGLLELPAAGVLPPPRGRGRR